MTSSPSTLALRPHHATEYMPQASLEAATDHRRGRHAIRITRPGDPDTFRGTDVRDLDAARAEVEEGGLGGLDLASVWAAARWMKRHQTGELPTVEGHPYHRLLAYDLDGSRFYHEAKPTA